MRKKIKNTRYYLDAKYPGIYFTKRELQCMQCFIVGFTNMRTAEVLNLSARTIESYLTKMKEKLACKTKRQLIEKVYSSSFNLKLKRVVKYKTTEIEKDFMSIA